MDDASDRPDAQAEGATRKTGYHHHNLRNAALAVTIDLIERRNGPHFSLREVAAALGVRHSSVYRHFADKAALLDALTAEGFNVLRALQVEECARHDPDVLGQMRAFCIAYVRFAQEKGGFFRLLFENRPEGEGEAAGRSAFNAEAYDALVALIRRGQDEGLLIPGDPGLIAGYLVLGPHGLAHYLSQPKAPGRSPAGPIPFMSAEQLSDFSIIPLLRHPPTPETIAHQFFGISEAGH